mgnify:CR=1 FL=1
MRFFLMYEYLQDWYDKIVSVQRNLQLYFYLYVSVLLALLNLVTIRLVIFFYDAGS